ARMAPFGGFEMPISYEGIIAEHTSTRTATTVFDTCHMGEFRISGDQAVNDLEKLLSSRIATMEVGQCRYGLLCNPEGGVIDDEITYRMGEQEFFMVVNAGTQDTDFNWIREHLSPQTAIENLSAETAKLDIQGPQSAKIMQGLLDQTLEGMRFYRFRHNSYRGEQVLISRTGYTGEIGFEVYCSPALALSLWDDLLARDVKPAGLGARDTLRLEMGLPLYGHELTATRNAAECGFMRSIADDKEFIGSGVILDPSRRTQRLVGMELEGRRAAREGDVVCDDSGTEVGTITSGSYGPSVGRSIALGYVGSAFAQPATRLQVRSARATLTATVVETPFYREATGRRPLKEFL
ncbi:MAG: glycine cleavage system aminomethyltransferase GcvT, partial [Chitinivibrionales bacterium]|nr:glycine cleavage system aminomethyltransferase GcvT [Chitinivibrionales bacterium]